MHDEVDEDKPNGKEEPAELHGHVKSISYRSLGLARKLMILSQEAMATIYKATFVSLHVRKSNKAAIALYISRHAGI
ncbi:hypothetical protein C8R43DRAFT_1040256 [Mycena crocata]|nr:hypothetical protein C8R43DRAFT_1040256 [Mycena crocata]